MELKEQQEPLSVAEQINNLKELGLTIEDEALANSFLNDVSYFRFIKAYSLGLKLKNGNYNPNVTFNQLRELYLFNSNFRQLIFSQIERIEVNLRCRISNYISTTYGVLSYYDSFYFSNSKYHSAFMSDVNSEISRNKRSPFIFNFQKNYVDGKIPFYALVEILSFGTLSKFFKNMKNPDKKAVAQTFGIGYVYFESWIESLSYIRNICAHYGRLYNAKLIKAPKLYTQDRKNGIANNRIFGVLICMAHILKKDIAWNSFIVSIEKLFEKYPHVKKDTMGCPDNWKELID